MNISTTVLEFTAFCLGILVLVSLTSQEGTAHPHLMLGGMLVALIGFYVIGLPGRKPRSVGADNGKGGKRKP
jgi:hypothetical protein